MNILYSKQLFKKNSGKSLIYGLPILSSLVKSRGRDISFCIFPTKALAQDQKQFINRVSNSIEDVDWIRVCFSFFSFSFSKKIEIIFKIIGQ